MNLDSAKTHLSFIKVGDKMEYLTRHVHMYVLESGFLESQGKRVLKAVKHIAERHDELLVQTFIGKLRFKLPELHMGLQLSDFDKQRARVIAASLITQILIDNQSFQVDKRVESVTVEGHKKFHTRLYLQLGGSYEKDLLVGIEDEPGVVNQKEINGWKLKSFEKDFLRKVASVPFCLSEVCSKELLMKGYSLKVDWNNKVDKHGRTLCEDPIMRKKRYQKYADTIMDVVKHKSRFYLPAKYCDRKRMYYEAAVLEGMRPHGKLWETLMIDSAVAYELTEADERVLKHIIYVILHDRVSIDEANEKFSLEDLLNAETVDPMEQNNEEGFGEAILLNKAAQAIMDFRNGIPSRFMFGYDFTNSGLLMSGVSFHSGKMMQAGNIAGSDVVVDSHTAFGAAYDLALERKDIKKIHMGLMHGSALESIAQTISQILDTEVTVEDVKAYNEKAYGPAVQNIPFIAEWGTKVVGNKQTTLRWTMPDGFSACSRAYLKGVPVLVYVASSSHKDNYTSYVIVSDMPWVEDRNGFPVYGKEVTVGGVVYEVEQKKRGLFANITHAIDSFMLRHIGEAVLATGKPMLFKHDDFIAMPSSLTDIQIAAKHVFSSMFYENRYQAALDEIVYNSPYDLEPVELIMDDGEFKVWESENFLMP